LAEIDSQEGNEAATFELTYSTTASISSLFPAPETLILCIIQVQQKSSIQKSRTNRAAYTAVGRIACSIPRVCCRKSVTSYELLR
jgi:hypothetical protein